MFEDDFDIKAYIKCIVQVLIVNFGFTEFDILKLGFKVEELYNTSLQEYLEKNENLHNAN